MLLKLPKLDTSKGDNNYWSTHFLQDPNVLAHMRVQDRVVPTYTKAQIEDIGKRMAETLGAEVSLNNLTRTHFSASQTRRGRISRWSNVKDIFWVREPEKFENKRILLIDDVITTGATIEACASALRKINGVHLSVGALAIPA
jgi:predicted amidophosphoribosyltransferase